MISFNWSPASKSSSSHSNWLALPEKGNSEQPAPRKEERAQQLIAASVSEASVPPFSIMQALRNKQKREESRNYTSVITNGRRRSPPEKERPLSPLKTDSQPEIEKDEEEMLLTEAANCHLLDSLLSSTYTSSL